MHINDFSYGTVKFNEGCTKDIMAPSLSIVWRSIEAQTQLGRLEAYDRLD